MDSSSQPATPVVHQNRTIANVIGTLIALLTLTLPLAVVAHYSDTISSPQPEVNSRSTLP